MAERQPMTKEQRNLLIRHWNTLKQSIRMDIIADTLIQTSVITEREWGEIQKNNMTEPEKTEALLHKLLANQKDDQRIKYLLRSVQQLQLNEKDFKRDKKVKDEQIKELMSARTDQEALKKKVDNLESELKHLQEQLRKKETQISKMREERQSLLDMKNKLQADMKEQQEQAEAKQQSLEKENTFLKEKLEEQKSELWNPITPRLRDPLQRESTTLSGLVEEQRQISETIDRLISIRNAIKKELRNSKRTDSEHKPSIVCVVL